MNQSALARAVVEAEDALNGPEFEAARARLREIDAERITITSTLDAAEKRLVHAQENLRAFFTAPQANEDVHAAIKAMADDPPATADRSNEPEEGEEVPAGFVLPSGAVTIGDLPRVHASDCSTHDAPALGAGDCDCAELPALADLSAKDQAEVEAVLDDDNPFSGLGGTTGLVVGRASDVTDADLAQARVQDARDHSRLNPWR